MLVTNSPYFSFYVFLDLVPRVLFCSPLVWQRQRKSYFVSIYMFKFQPLTLCYKVLCLIYNHTIPAFNTSVPFYLNPFPNRPWFLRVCSTSLLKTLWEKEKLLVTSNFSFSHSIFYLSLNLKLSSANSFSFEKSKICCLGKGKRALTEKIRLLETSG